MIGLPKLNQREREREGERKSIKRDRSEDWENLNDTIKFANPEAKKDSLQIW